MRAADTRLDAGRTTTRDIRRQNRSGLLSKLFFDGPLSRLELSQLTGLSSATVSTVTADLIEDRLVIEAGQVESNGGRPRVLLRVDPAYGYVIGVDVGETGVTVELFDLGMARRASVVRPLRSIRPTPDAVVAEVVAGIEAVLADPSPPLPSDGSEPVMPGPIDPAQVIGIGIGVPGIVEDGDATLVHAPTIGWHAVRLARPAGQTRRDPAGLRRQRREDPGAGGDVVRRGTRCPARRRRAGRHRCRRGRHHRRRALPGCQQQRRRMGSHHAGLRRPGLPLRRPRLPGGVRRRRRHPRPIRAGSRHRAGIRSGRAGCGGPGRRAGRRHRPDRRDGGDRRTHRRRRPRETRLGRVGAAGGDRHVTSAPASATWSTCSTRSGSCSAAGPGSRSANRGCRRSARRPRSRRWSHPYEQVTIELSAARRRRGRIGCGHAAIGRVPGPRRRPPRSVTPGRGIAFAG